MLTHHLFADSATLEMMNVQCMFPEEILLIISGAGKVCVAIFVFISAYGITMSNNENNNTTIVISRRIVKLLVPFMYIYIIAAIVAIVTGLWAETYGTVWQSMIYYCLLDFCGLANLFGTPTLNGTWWYMSLAILLPIIITLFIKIYEKIGIVGTIIVGIYIPACLGVEDTSPYRWWILTVVFGIIFAKNNVFEKIKALKHSYLLYGTIILLSIPIVYMRHGIGGYWLLDTLLVFPFVVIAYGLERIPVVKNIFYELGRASHYMFLTHTFIFYYYFREFIYYWKYPIVILVVLVVCSYLLARILSVSYKILKISNLEQFFLKKIGNKVKK